MKNTLKIVLLCVGIGFLAYSLYGIFALQETIGEARRQFYAMMGVGVLFLLAGGSMGSR